MNYGEQIRKATHAYVGYCPCGCGAMVAAQVDTPGFADHVAKNLADFKKSGVVGIEYVEIARTASLMPCLRKQEKHRKAHRDATAQATLPLGGA